MLYLIEGRLERSDYMEERRKEPQKVTRIVEADDWKSAEEKFTKHFESQSRPYDVSYYVTIDETNEVIK